MIYVIPTIIMAVFTFKLWQFMLTHKPMPEYAPYAITAFFIVLLLSGLWTNRWANMTPEERMANHKEEGRQ